MYARDVKMGSAEKILAASKKLKKIITGSKIHSFTDHDSLIYLTESMSKLLRWALALQAFDADVK